MTELRECTNEQCTLKPHVENCHKCFGFGRNLDGTLISASEAWEIHKHYRPTFDVVPCDVCGGDALKGWRTNETT